MAIPIPEKPRSANVSESTRRDAHKHQYATIAEIEREMERLSQEKQNLLLEQQQVRKAATGKEMRILNRNLPYSESRVECAKIKEHAIEEERRIGRSINVVQTEIGRLRRLLHTKREETDVPRHQDTINRLIDINLTLKQILAAITENKRGAG